MIAAAFACLALFAYCPGFLSAFSVPKVLVLAAGLLGFALALVQGARVNLGKSLAVPALPLLAVALVSAACSQDHYLSLVGRYNGFAQGLATLFLALVYHVAASSSERPARALRLIAAASGLLGVHALAQWAGLVGPIAHLTGNRAVGLSGSPVDLGMLFAMVLPLAIFESPIYGAAVALGIMATGTRGAWLAGMAGIFVYAMRTSARVRNSVIVVMLVAPAASVIFALYSMKDRPLSQSNSERVEVWKVAVAAIKERPILGHGPDGFENVFRKLKTQEYVRLLDSDMFRQADAHNDLLQATATLGLLGLLAYLTLQVAIFRSVWRNPAILGGMAALFVNLKVNPMPIEVFILAAVLVGLSSGRTGKTWTPSWASQGALSLCFMSCWLVTYWFGFADLLAAKNESSTLDTAASMNPWEVSYKARLINAVVRDINATKDPALRGLLIETARGHAAQGIRLRPAVSTSWYVAGIECAIERELHASQCDPMPYLVKARELDPLFGPVRVAIQRVRLME